MFRHLGWIMYSTRCGPNAVDAVEELMQIFVDQCAFMDYFKSRWLDIIGIFQVMVSFVFIEETYTLALVALHYNQFFISTLCDSDFISISFHSKFHLQMRAFSFAGQLSHLHFYNWIIVFIIITEVSNHLIILTN